MTVFPAPASAVRHATEVWHSRGGGEDAVGRTQREGDGAGIRLFGCST